MILDVNVEALVAARRRVDRRRNEHRAAEGQRILLAQQMATLRTQLVEAEKSECDSRRDLAEAVIELADMEKPARVQP